MNERINDLNGSENVGKLLPDDNSDLLSNIPDYLNLNPELPAHLMFGYPDYNPYPEFPNFPVMESYPAGRDVVQPVLNDLINSDAMKYCGTHDDSCGFHEDEGALSRKPKPTTQKPQSKPLSLEDLTYDSSRFAKVVKAFLSIEDEKMRTVPEIAKRVDEMFPGQYSDFEGVKVSFALLILFPMVVHSRLAADGQRRIAKAQSLLASWERFAVSIKSRRRAHKTGISI